MTVLEFWGCTLITFGPALAMFSLTVARDPIKVILLISSSFFWLVSFLLAAICWSVINLFCDYLIVGAALAVFSQESFRYLFHLITKKARVYLARIMNSENEESARQTNKSSSRTNEILLNGNETVEFRERISLSYVSGLGFGLMNAAFSLMNVLTDHIGPGTVGLKGDSPYFLLVSSLTALAFILLNVSWSIIMSEAIEKADKKMGALVLKTHLMVTSITFLNTVHLQLITLVIIYSFTVLCGLGAFKVAGMDLRRLMSARTPSTIR